jgi:hypothetical protein
MMGMSGSVMKKSGDIKAAGGFLQCARAAFCKNQQPSARSNARTPELRHVPVAGVRLAFDFAVEVALQNLKFLFGVRPEIREAVLEDHREHKSRGEE